MVRIYKKKNKINEDVVCRAVNEWKEKKDSLRNIAKKYNLDKSLLSRRISGQMLKQRGRKTALSLEDERKLASHLKDMAKWGFALTTKEIKNVVADYVSENNIKTPFNSTTGKPGKDWMTNFMRRHNLSIRNLEKLEMNRRTATADPFIIYKFYDLLQEVLTTLNISDKPSHIYNLDETYICSDPLRVKCVAGKGQKVHRNIQGSGKDNTSILACCSASGKLLPPLIIFSGQHLWSTWKGKHDIQGTFYASSAKGYMTSVIFQDWFVKFCGLVKERPLLLVLDGHLSHLDLGTLEKAKEEQITILKLPPHTTETLQPLDKACFKPLKDRWNERLHEWQRVNMRKISRSEMVDLLCEIWTESISQKTIQAGFTSTGIFPCNREKYPKHRLDPRKLEIYSTTRSTQAGCSTETVRLSSPTTVSPVTVSEPLAGPSDAPDMPEPISSTPEKNTELKDITFAELLLRKIKRTTPILERRRKIEQHSEIVTSEEYMSLVKNKSNKSEKGRHRPVGKLRTKTAQNKKKGLSDSETSEDEEWQESGDSLDDIDPLEEESSSSETRDVSLLSEPNEVKVGDYVLVRFVGGKRKTVVYKYVCVVQKIYPVSDEYDVMCMNMISGNKTLFKMNEADVTLVHRSDIIGVLPVPFISCNGQRMQYSFAQPVDVCEK